MSTSPEPDPEVLAKSIAHSRRFYDCVWIALTVLVASVGVVVWPFTRNIEHLFTGLFYAAFPFGGLVYNHFFLFTPRRNPAATKTHLEKVALKQQQNTRRVCYVNGTLIILASPILFVLGINSGGAEYGTLGAIDGALPGISSFAFGLAMVIWARRAKLHDAERDQR